GADFDAKILIEDRSHVLRLEPLDGQTDDTDAIAFRLRAEEVDACNCRERFEQLADESLLLPMNTFHAALQKPAERCIQSDKAGGVVVSRFIFVGERLGLEILLALRPRSALPQARQPLFRARADVQDSRSQRPQQTLVSGTGQKV